MGDQTASPYIVCDEELTMIPIKLTMEKPNGTATSCGHTAADGYVAREAKSGALLMGSMNSGSASCKGQTYVTKVAMLLMHDMRLATIFQPRTLPWIVEGWWTMGPAPCALMMHQMKNVIPAIGVTIALTVNRWRLCANE